MKNTSIHSEESPLTPLISLEDDKEFTHMSDATPPDKKSPSLLIEYRPSHGASRPGSIKKNESIELSVDSTAGEKVTENDLKKTFGERTQPQGTMNQKKLEEIVSAYCCRTCCEDVDLMASLGGTAQMLWDLHVSPHEGLVTSEQVVFNRRLGGSNRMPARTETPFIKLFWDACRDPMLTVLMCCSVVSIVLGVVWGENPKIEWIEGASMFVAVLIVILVTSVNDFVKEKRFATLAAEEIRKTNAVRAGQQKVVDVADLVLGDVLCLGTGDEVPADCILVSQHGLLIDEASVSGESELLTKRPLEDCILELEAKKHLFKEALEQTETADIAITAQSPTAEHEEPLYRLVSSPVLLAGSVATAGSGIAVVVAVGSRSQAGKLYQKLLTETEATPLQQKLNALARHVGVAGFLAALATLIILIIVYFSTFSSLEQKPSAKEIVNTMIEYVVTAITIVVVAVPEGLPLAVTISLAFSIHLMMKDQNYVRRLAACETMGGATEICSDKTGTLTKNQMEVTAFWNGSRLSYTVNELLSGCGDVPLPPEPHRTALMHNVAVNSSAYLEKRVVVIGDGSKRTKEMSKQVGSPTEAALLQMIQSLGYDYDALRKAFSGKEKYEEARVKPRTVEARVVEEEGNGQSSEEDDGSSVPQSEQQVEIVQGRQGLLYAHCKDLPLVVDQVPFSSSRKAMTTCVRHPLDESLYRVFTKGASEVVLRRCRYRVNGEGKLKRLSDSKLRKIESSVINEFADRSLRTICLAYRDFNPAEIPDWNQVEPNGVFWKVEAEMVCLGIAGIRDPLRPEVPGAVAKCQDAGIRVRMCTGDNLRVARQIALDAQIYHPEKGGMAMLGPEFYELVGKVVCKKCRTEECPCPRTTQQKNAPPSPSASPCAVKPSNAPSSPDRVRAVREDVLGNPDGFESVVDHLEVLARSQPNDKHALVLGLRQRGAIVAVTGDGVNDAPALKCADVGFAMGIAGKEVAKRAADIILLDDNFESIVKACKWGRNIYDNIQRFLQFQLTVNVVAVITAFFGAMLLKESPLTAIQLLWVNLIMDTFAALALATEPPTDALLERPPRKRSDYLVNKQMVCNIIAQVIYQITVLTLVTYRGECWLPESDFAVNPGVLNDYPDFTKFESSGHCGNGHTVRSGRRYHFFSNKEDYKKVWNREIGPSRHYTLVFNIFVMMQAFNFFNCRRINAREFNIFSNLWANHIWQVIILGIVAGQVMLVQFGREPVGCHPEGLTGYQWLISLAFGLGTWAAALVGKMVPRAWVERLPQTGKKEVDLLDEPTSLALASRGRISSGRVYARMHISGQMSERGSRHLKGVQLAGLLGESTGRKNAPNPPKSTQSLRRRLTAAGLIPEEPARS